MLRPIIALVYLLSTCWAQIHEYDFPSDQTIEKDVAILGGGASGAYAAVRLREDYGSNIILIEKKDRLGGHANTYVDPVTNTSINYGVQVYIPYGPAQDFFARFNIDTVNSLTVLDLNTTTTTVDIANGQTLPEYRPPSSDALSAGLEVWLNMTKKYETEMTPGLWNFFAPGSIPAELLLPFDAFARKYGIEAVAPSFATTANVGVGGFDNISTWEIMAFAFGSPVTEASLNLSFFVPKDKPNTFLYDKIYDLMRDDVMLNSQVVAAERDATGVRLVVQSKDGSKTLVKAKRLLVSFEPTLRNLASLQLDQQELDFWETFTPTWLYTSILKIPFIPASSVVNYISPRAVPDNYLAIRDTSYSFSFHSTGPPNSNLVQALITANYTLSHDEAKTMILENVMKLVSAGTFNVSSSYTPEDVEIVAFASHSSVLWRQSPEVAQAGLVQKALALQGHQSTWYCSPLWTNDFSANVWAFTDTVLPRMMEEQKSSKAV